MGYEFQILTQEQAEKIAYHWHYKEKYSFYNMEADEEDLEEFLNTQEDEEDNIMGTVAFTFAVEIE